MSDEKLTYEDLLQIVELVKASEQFTEFRLKVGDVEIELKRAPAGATDDLPSLARAASAVAPVTPTASPVPESATAARAMHHRTGHIGGGEVVTELPADVRRGESTRRAAPLDYPQDALLIKSPMVGTFYRAPEPGARPFVEIGQQVDADTTVCIIEVMKLMNSIPAGGSGVVTQVLVDDGDPVEYGQVLMVVEPR